MSAVTLVHRLTSMCLPLGAFWPLGLTRCCRRGSLLLQTSLQVDGTVYLRRVATKARSATVTQSLVCSVSGQCACHYRRRDQSAKALAPPEGSTRGETGSGIQKNRDRTTGSARSVRRLALGPWGALHLAHMPLRPRSDTARLPAAGMLEFRYGAVTVTN